MANCVAVVLARESCSIVVAVFLLTVFFATNVRGQGTFTVNITGTELFGGTRLPINGGGMLQFERGNLSYNLFVPVQFVLPREAHFHGPPVDNEHPIISLVPFVQERGGIRYSGSSQIPGKFHPDLLAGNWYINLHATDYENGILTGAILPVPESSPALLFGSGASLILLVRRSTLNRKSTPRPLRF